VTRRDTLGVNQKGDSVKLETKNLPELILICESTPDPANLEGRWKFRLETNDGLLVLEADDVEAADAQRLALYSVIRGLEAIEAPSKVTLVIGDRYILQGLRRGLATWRDTDFRWEHYGRMLPVANADLWRRIDRALSIHRVQACWVSAACVSLGKELSAESPLPTRTQPDTRLDGPFHAPSARVIGRRLAKSPLTA
jgi:ribonuclease HI